MSTNTRNIIIGLGVLVIAFVFIFTDGSNSDTGGSNSDWVGTFEGKAPSYKLTRQDGTPMYINGQYLTMDPVTWTFEIFNNNKCTITMDVYTCNDIAYTVSENTLTMKPETGSDCGGHPIVLTKNNDEYSIGKGALGRPVFNVTKQ